jgi:hypothetical protein
MPKPSGQDLKITRTSPKPQPSRPIKRFAPPSAPLVRPSSPGAPKIAADLKPAEKHPTGSIDPRQMRY